ncbi:unnamed protein product [Fusarium graminearum]|nr:unnamed protein product [Fusarium graminearum]CAG1977434.1 unnamed protein product [Fusarium graminearum]VTO92451.1 unnamed protein product [Fusarium graminearum]
MGCWTTNTATDITTNALFSQQKEMLYRTAAYQDTSSEPKEGSFTSTATASCQIAVEWVYSSSIYGAGGFKMHDRLRLCSSCVKYTAFVIQIVVKQVGSMGLVDPCYKRRMG